LNRQSADSSLQAYYFSPEYLKWDESTKIMFLERRILLLKKQMVRQERLADNHRSLLKSIHKEYESALERLQDKHSELKKVSQELLRTKKDLQREVRKRTRELEMKNIALEKRAMQLEKTNITLDVLLQKYQENEKSGAGEMDEHLLAEIIPALKTLAGSLDNKDQTSLVEMILDRIKAGQHCSTCLKNEKLLDLSDREVMVARLISQGRNCAEAAEALGISLRGVQSHCYNIRKKLGLSRKVRLRDHLNS
jgi:DNA-binding CsgD family transcriptional regulator